MVNGLRPFHRQVAFLRVRLWSPDIGQRGRMWAMAAQAGTSGSRPWRHVALFVATLVTTTWAGAVHQGIDLLSTPRAWPRGLPYALALLAILGVHEMAHVVMARRRGVAVSLPFFIPAPLWLGTFGAFIVMRGPIRDRTTYFDVGLAGPLAGLGVALAALWIGLQFEPPTAVSGHGMSPHTSALFAGVYHVVVGGALRDTVTLGPVAFAGWLGLVVTALNLLPVGQLDGGHVSYALLGPSAARQLSVGFVVALVGGGLVLGSHLWMWGVLAWLVAGTGHPPAQDEATLVGPGRWVVGTFAFALLLAILLPVPGSG